MAVHPYRNSCLTMEEERGGWVDSDADTVRHLVRPVLEENLTHRQQNDALLRLLERDLPKYGSAVHQRVAEELLQNLFVTSSAVEQTLCDCLVLGCGQRISLSAAIQTLKVVDKEDIVALELSLDILRQILFTRVRSVDVSMDWVTQDWVSLLLRLPSLIANACRKVSTDFPSWATRTKYYPRLVQCALDRALVPGAGDQYCLCLVQQMLRRGGEEVAMGVFLAFEHSRHDKGNLIDFMNRLLGDLVPREFSVVSRSMVQLALANKQQDDKTGFSHEWVNATLRPILASKSEHCDAFVRLMVLSTSSSLDTRLSNATASLLAGLTETNGEESDSDDEDSNCKEDMPEQDRVLRRYLGVIAESWSETAFARHTDVTVQRHVTTFLQRGLRYLVASKIDVTSSIVARLLEGVTERMSSSKQSIRIDGMVVAELLAKKLGEELRFDELDEERSSFGATQDTAEFIAPTNADAAVDPRKRTNTKANLFTGRSKQTDPDADYVSEEDEERGTDSDSYSDDSSWGDDSVLVPYDLEDDEDDIRETQKPLYLVDCLELLQTDEKNEHAASRHGTALREVANLVRSRPIDLPDIGAKLAFELLRMENKFALNDFTECISTALCALAVEEPFSVGETLIEEMYKDLSLADRLTVLEAINTAAVELSGSNHLYENHGAIEGQRYGYTLASCFVHTIFPLALTCDNGSNTSRALVGASLVKSGRSLGGSGTYIKQNRTRRWGTKSSRTDNTSEANRFREIAPAWFYLLLGRFLENKDKKRIWGGTNGAAFLAKLFQTLATIVECCRNSPGTDVLAKDLIQLVWGFRSAEISEVRASVLFALAASFGQLRTEVMLALILKEHTTDSMAYQLPIMAEHDPDESARSIARLLVQNVARAMHSTNRTQGGRRSLMANYL